MFIECSPTTIVDVMQVVTVTTNRSCYQRTVAVLLKYVVMNMQSCLTDRRLVFVVFFVVIDYIFTLNFISYHNILFAV